MSQINLHKFDLSTLPETTLDVSSFPGAGCFYLRLPWPISYNVYASKGKRWASKAGRVWRDEMSRAIWQQVGRTDPEPLLGKVALYQELWLPDDNRLRDLDNFTGKHIQDLFQAAGLVPNDANIAEEHRYKRGKYRRGALVVHLIEL